MDFGLNDEQLTYQAECRGFAREVIRPAAPCTTARRHPLGGHQRGAPAGLRRHRGHAARGRRRRGPDAADHGREVPLGLRRDRPGDQRLRPRRRGRRLLRHPRADDALGARVLRDAETVKLGAYAVTERRPARRQEPEDDRRPRGRRMGPQRHQGLHHQRRDRRPHRRRRHRRPDPRHPRPGLFRDREGDAGAVAGQEGVEARDPRLAYRRGGARGLPNPGRAAARRRREAASASSSGGAAARNRAPGPTRWRPSR